MNWHENCFRKLFFDFHNQATAKEMAKDFNAENWAEQLAEVGAQAVSAFAKGGYGWRYYREGKVGWIHPNLPTNLDMLGETISACHKRGIKVIAYYHTFNSEPIAEKYPDWIWHNRKEEPEGINICMLSPLLEEHMLPQIEEILHYYEIDGIFFDGTCAGGPCYCKYCKEKFRKNTGLDIPFGSDEPNWEMYVRWKLEVFKKIRQKITEVIHKNRKEVLVAFNWAYTTRQPETPPEDIGFLTLDIPPDNQVFNGSYEAKYLATLGKPFDIMNTGFLQWWGDWGMKPATSLKQECATIIANGGKTFIGYQMYPQFKVERAVMNELKKVLTFIKEREDLCKDSIPIPYIGILNSTNSYFTHKPGFFVDNNGLRGAHKMLLEGGFHHNIVNERTLLETIDQYKAVILPDQQCLDFETIVALEKFVENGGGLIATYLTGTEDKKFRPTGKVVLEELFGVTLERRYPHSHAYIELKDERLKYNVLDMPILTWANFVYVKPTTAKILADLKGIYLRGDGQFLLASSPPGENTGYPAITINQVGKGKVVYISGDIFSGYIKKNQWNLKHILKNLLNLIIPEKLVEIGAPDMVEVVLAKQNNRTLVHLINHNGERSIEKNYALAEDIIPIYDIEVRAKVDSPPKIVKIMPEGVEPNWRIKDEVLSVEIPKLKIHSCIVIDSNGQ